MKNTSRALIGIGMCLTALCVLALCATGCSGLQTPGDDQRDAYRTTGATVGGLVGTVAGGPAGAAAGASLGGGLGDLVWQALGLAGVAATGHYRGKEKGWTEATGVPSTPPQAKIG